MNGLRASPHTSEAAENTIKPAVKTILRPILSAIDPETSSRIDNVRA